MKLLAKFYENLLIVGLCCASPLLGLPWACGEAPAEIRATEISREILSPFCPGRLLSDCPSASASDLKREIEQRLEQGESEKEIKESLYALYGSEIRAAPELEGVGLLAWTAPAIFFGIGLLFLALWLKAKSGPSGEEPGENSDIDPAIKAEIERAVRGGESA